MSRFVTTESRGFKDFKYDIDYYLVTTKTKTKSFKHTMYIFKSREVKYSYSSNKFHQTGKASGAWPQSSLSSSAHSEWVQLKSSQKFNKGFLTHVIDSLTFERSF